MRELAFQQTVSFSVVATFLADFGLFIRLRHSCSRWKLGGHSWARRCGLKHLEAELRLGLLPADLFRICSSEEFVEAYLP